MAKIPLNKKSAVIIAPLVPTKQLAFISIFNATDAYNVDECKKTTNSLSSCASKQFATGSLGIYPALDAWTATQA